VTEISQSKAWAAASRYRDQMIAGAKGALSELFAPDATFHNRNGDAVQGRDAIREFLDAFLAGPSSAVMQLGQVMVDANRCWVEFHNATDQPDKPTTASHFEVDDDGLIVRLAVFNR
jgi:uncharacterized protein (TIGR02246 family)